MIWNPGRERFSNWSSTKNFTLTLGPAAGYLLPQTGKRRPGAGSGARQFNVYAGIFDSRCRSVIWCGCWISSRVPGWTRLIGRIDCDHDHYLVNPCGRFSPALPPIGGGDYPAPPPWFQAWGYQKRPYFCRQEEGHYRWIDFDYDFYLPERPFALDLIGLGNILLYILGRKNFRPVDVLQ